MASAMLHAYENMYPRRRSDPAADPRSAQKYIESVRRTHRVKSITMASMEIVRLAHISTALMFFRGVLAPRTCSGRHAGG